MMAFSARRAALLAAGTILACTIASPLFASPQRQIKIYFINSGVQAGATGKLLFVENPAQSFVKIKVTGMTPGPYDVMLSGAIVDSLTVGADGKGSVTHRSKVNPRHGNSPLPYDPRGGAFEIQAAGIALLTANVPGTPAEAQQKTRINIVLTNMGIQTGASANATLVSRFGRMQFEVEMDGALPGTYDLVVDGVKKGEIVVDAAGSGEVEFDSQPSTDEDDDNSLDLLLTFDPRGRMITIMQGLDLNFSDPFPMQ